MYLDTKKPEHLYYDCYLDGELVYAAVAAHEEEGWVDRYVMVSERKLQIPIQLERVYGKVELRRK